MVILEIGSTTRGKVSYLYPPRSQHRSGLASRQDLARPDPDSPKSLPLLLCMPETVAATRDDFRLNPSAAMPQQVAQI